MSANQLKVGQSLMMMDKPFSIVCRLPYQIINVLQTFPATKRVLNIFHFQGLPELDVTIESLEILEGKNMCATLVYQRLIRRGYMTEEGGLVF
jgi:hypothetical protein